MLTELKCLGQNSQMILLFSREYEKFWVHDFLFPLTHNHCLIQVTHAFVRLLIFNDKFYVAILTGPTVTSLGIVVIQFLFLHNLF